MQKVNYAYQLELDKNFRDQGFIKATLFDENEKAVRVFYNDEISSVEVDKEVDPINRNLPQYKCTLNIIDFTGKYDFDHPDEIYKIFDKRHSLLIEYGQVIHPVIWKKIKKLTFEQLKESYYAHLVGVDSLNSYSWDDLMKLSLPESSWERIRNLTYGDLAGKDNVSWVSLGKFTLTGKPVVSDNIVTFEGADAISVLDDTFIDSNISAGKERMLKDIAISVLKSAQIKDYNLDDSLSQTTPLDEIETTGMFPKDILVREALQIIASAGNRYLYCDINNNINITDRQNIHDYHLTKNNYFDIKGEKIAGLKSLSTNVYTYKVAAESSEVYSREGAKIVANKAHSERVNLDNLVVPVESYFTDAEGNYIAGTKYTKYGNTGVYSVLARSSKISTGSKNRIFVLSGKAIESSQGEIFLDEPGFIFDKTGEEEVLNNALITNETMAENQMKYIYDYLSNRITYTFNHRGYPELEPLDIIDVDTDYQDKIKAQIIKTKLIFDGTLKGELVAKKIKNDDNAEKTA